MSQHLQQFNSPAPKNSYDSIINNFTSYSDNENIFITESNLNLNIGDAE